MKDVTVIVPMYNSKNYIKKCIKSLINQSFKNFNVILIDDFSKDDTVKEANLLFCNSNIEYEIIELKENVGPGEARNKGLEKAKGEYITFVDSDDWIHKEYIERLFLQARKNDCDITFCDYYKAYSNDKTEEVRDSLFSEANISSLDYAALCNDGVTRKLIKKEIIDKNNIIFPKWKNGEDIEFCIQIALKSKKIIYVKEPLYYYYQRNNSLSNSNIEDERLYYKLFENFKKNIKYCNLCEKEDEIIRARAMLDLLYNTTVLMLNQNINTKHIKNHLKEVNNEYNKLYKNYAFKYYPIIKKVFIIFASFNLVSLLKIMYMVKSFMKG